MEGRKYFISWIKSSRYFISVPECKIGFSQILMAGKIIFVNNRLALFW